MKQGLERRLRKLEGYQAELDAPIVIDVCWLTAAEIKQGVEPGLYPTSPEDLVSFLATLHTSDPMYKQLSDAVNRRGNPESGEKPTPILSVE